MSKAAIDDALLAELDDFFADLVGDFADARAQGHRDFRSAVGSKFEAKVRRLADRLHLTRNPPPRKSQ